MSTAGVRSLYRITPEVTSPPPLSFASALTLDQADTERLECTPDQLLAIVPGLQIRDLQFGTHPHHTNLTLLSVNADTKRQIACIVVRGSAVLINVELLRAIVTVRGSAVCLADDTSPKRRYC